MNAFDMTEDMNTFIDSKTTLWPSSLVKNSERQINQIESVNSENIWI